MKVVIQYGCYHCGECGQALKFDPVDMRDDTSFAIGHCTNGHECYDHEHLKRNCKRYDIRLRIPVQTIECEVVK